MLSIPLHQIDVPLYRVCKSVQDSITIGWETYVNEYGLFEDMSEHIDRINEGFFDVHAANTIRLIMTSRHSTAGTFFHKQFFFAIFPTDNGEVLAAHVDGPNNHHTSLVFKRNNDSEGIPRYQVTIYGFPDYIGSLLAAVEHYLGLTPKRLSTLLMNVGEFKGSDRYANGLPFHLDWEEKCMSLPAHLLMSPILSAIKNRRYRHESDEKGLEFDDERAACAYANMYRFKDLKIQLDKLINDDIVYFLKRQILMKDLQELSINQTLDANHLAT